MAMGLYFRLVTRMTPPEIARVETGVKSGEIHPRDAKMLLAKEIVGTFYGDENAVSAEKNFVDTFQKGSIPDDIQSLHFDQALSIIDLLISAELAKSKSDARRLIEQKGVKFEGNVIEDPATLIDKSGVLQVGKRHFLKVQI